MTSLVHSQTSFSLGGPHKFHGTVTGGVMRRLFEKIRFELDVRRSLREVAGFDDNMLRDIGLQRGGIEYALRHGVSDEALDTMR